MSAVLQREVFTTSRLAEFCTRRELEKQTGHSAQDWPIYVVKELMDNALDAAEDVGAAPQVSIIYDTSQLVVIDQGPGIAPETVARLCDLSSRTSSRSRYVSPTRGAQGQALSTILVMPHALDPEADGSVLIQSRGYIHRITVEINKLTADPRLARSTAADPVVKTGTTVIVQWPQSASTIVQGATGGILLLYRGYRLANPHLSLFLSIAGKAFDWHSSNPAWKKWRACDPTSAHWYDRETFGRLIAALIHKDQQTGKVRPIREFIKEFAGLSSTQKHSKILAGLDLHRAPLSDLLHGDELDQGAIADLLAAMKADTKPVKPERLGVIGKAHLADSLPKLGFKYASAAGMDRDGFPYLIEGAFAVDDEPGCTRSVGINFGSSPSLSLRSSLGSSVEGMLSDRFCGLEEPISVFIHIVHPRPNFTDLGKTKIRLSDTIWADLRTVVERITAAWQKQKLREIRDASAAARRRDNLERAQNRRMTIKESVYRHLPDAYKRASGGIAARSRQIFYQLRPLVLADTGKESLNSQYIEQQLIPDFVAENPEITANWVIFYDDRGHAIEPHTRRAIGLGTKNVRAYCASWGPPIISPCELSEPTVSTSGPEGRYGAILFCEKEGFTEVFQAVDLQEKYDLMLTSTKGTSVTACRELFEETARRGGDHDLLQQYQQYLNEETKRKLRETMELADRLGGIPIFTLTDFDYNGFEIRATLHQDTRRYQYQHRPKIIDIGLRLADVEGMQSEPVVRENRTEALAANLRRYGATEEEIAFLLKREIQGGNKRKTEGHRVELNALTTPQLIGLIEKALVKHGVQKVIPSADVLAETYRCVIEYQQAQKLWEEAQSKAREEQAEITIPPDLLEQVVAHQADNPTDSWDDAIWSIARSEGARDLQ